MLGDKSNMIDGNKLKTVRLNRNLTRQELSALAQVPDRTLQDWEYGITTFKSLDHIIKIAKVLNCNVQEFFKDEVLDNFTTSNNFTHSEKKLIKFLIESNIEKLSSYQTEIALELLDKLK